eukprot:TRINITY_DN6022_c0_g1_i1.p1 TRINITY_DN6022_c0_g1~~TRINITY_DN6022_c0_g1_i1.p1  ORF type:complete len:378 (+),score=156.32 TRINITY_DN6022_c0_g1_i1:376-1509(+)
MQQVPASPALRLSNIDERYEINMKNVVGAGAFSQVVFAECKSTGQSRAVKVMQKKVMVGKKAEMVAHEKEILRRTNHPSIVKLYECVETDEQVFMVLERMDTDLYEWIRLNKKLCEQDASKVCRALLEATAYLHEHSIVHRDIKPENILINNTDDIRLADFGLAKVLSNDMVQATPCGTSFYIAPEIIRAIQMNGVRPLLTTSHDVKFLDMWSIGVVLYIMLAGTPPFVGQIRSKREREDLLKKIDRGVLFPDHKWASISDDAKDLVEGLLTIDPAKRMTAKEALESRFIKCWEDQPQTMLATPGIFQELGTREQIIKHMEPVVEYKNDVNQYHDETERLDTAKPAPAPGSNAVSAIPSGKVNLPLPPMLGKKKQGL